MPRRMSVALTLDAVRERRKTVTRRKVDTWRGLEAGDRLTLVEKGMGLPKGSKQVVVAEVEIVDVRVQLLSHVDEADVRAEGFTITPAGFARFWLDSHGYRQDEDPLVRRIEWRYLDDPLTVGLALFGTLAHEAMAFEWCPSEASAEELDDHGGRDGLPVHCVHWYECEPCCRCGSDDGAEGCHCRSHRPDLYDEHGNLLDELEVRADG